MVLCRQHWGASLCWASTEKSQSFKIFCVLGLCGELLAARMAGGVASVRRYWQVALHQVETMPVGSKMDPTWAKPEPVSDSGDALRVMFLRERGKKCSTATIAAKERTKNV